MHLINFHFYNPKNYLYSKPVKGLQGYEEGYGFSFNGKEKDDEICGVGNSFDFGMRIYNSRLGRWLSIDPKTNAYPAISPYVYALNTPIKAIDPDGGLVLFVQGFDPTNGIGNSRSSARKEMSFGKDIDNYWAGIDQQFIKRIGDNNVRYFDGESSNRSQANDRYKEGQTAAKQLLKQISSGEVKLEKNDAGQVIESIKIVAHSQGAAYSAGLAKELQKMGFNVEVVYYLAPHQPADFVHPKGIRGVQYSHPDDEIASKNFKILGLTFNGGSKLAQIEGVDEYMPFQQPGGKKIEYGGHKVKDHAYTLVKYESCGNEGSGAVMPRQDSQAASNQTITNDSVLTLKR